MDRFGSVKNLIEISPSLPNRRGKRPITIRGPLHVQCSDHGDDQELRHLVDEVMYGRMSKRVRCRLVVRI